MKTITIPVSEILEQIYALSALHYIGHRQDQQKPAILHRDHARALIPVLRNAAIIVAAQAPGIHQCTFNADTTNPADSTITLTADPAIPDAAITAAISDATALVTLHIAYGAAGIPSNLLDQALANLRQDRRPAAPGKTRPWPY